MATSSPDSSGSDEADDDLDAAYAAAVIDNPAYPYDSEEEQQVARAVRNARAILPRGGVRRRDHHR
ncbi:hypothetical protein C6A88_06445 [Mycolicibacterium austroafricanum]|nr:MAG: hypothetical protein CK431_08550 [Mycobacterium sp.]PQP52195.1 hypothetical protein C6A88_06445 [Mycolicibacterium austroafricanum]PZT85659.1 MAG: hypothetical protein DI630_35830 [Gordonia sp. (in: high G+C Gram-positive bacteria)]